MKHRYTYIAAALFLVVIAVIRIVSTYYIFNHTVDEPADIACGLEWLDRGSYLFGPDHPPLARIASGAGLFLAGNRLSDAQLQLLSNIESKEIKWHGSYRWKAGREILHSNGKYFYNLSLARLGIIPFFILLIIVTWKWSHKLFGDTISLISLFFITTIPSILGHAGLATTDIAVTGLCLSGLLAFTCWLDRPNYRSGFLFGLAWGLAAITKFSALLFLPVSAAAIVCWRVVLGEKREYSQKVPSITDQIKPRLFTLSAAAFVALVVMWSGYRFSTEPLVIPENRPQTTVSRIEEDKEPIKEIAYRILESPVFPLKTFFYGIWMQKKHHDRGEVSYLLGEYSTHGWWYFFPVVFLIKTPLSLLFFAGIGVVTLAFKTQRRIKKQAFIPFVAAFTIMLSVVPANINLGVRYILIVYPLLAVIAGYGAVSLLQLKKHYTLGRILFVVFFVWYILSTSFSHPDYIAYFNELAYRAPEKFRNGSDLDWGQDLHRLSIELKKRNVNKLSLAYYGSADPRNFNLPSFTILKHHQRARGWIAISVYKLKDIGGPPPHDGYAWLEKYQPMTTVGKSIKLYHIPGDV